MDAFDFGMEVSVFCCWQGKDGWQNQSVAVLIGTSAYGWLISFSTCLK